MSWWGRLFRRRQRGSASSTPSCAITSSGRSPTYVRVAGLSEPEARRRTSASSSAGWTR